LSERKIIHRDVAARNVLITDDRHGVKCAKICDFGLCITSNRELYMNRVKHLPIKWMALESLTKMEFSEWTDV
jgi:serine/threonine protein kinase